jgi:SAM-dependent methyltransferase
VSRWSERGDVPRGDDYDARWRALAEQGESIHGEADCLCRLLDRGSVLDAGCGTGRVAIEMAARGYDVVGVDLDEGMLETARTKAPDVEWHLADLLDVELGRRFDLIALPGNVMIFLAPGTEAPVIANLARHLEPGGLFVAGFQLSAQRLSLADYDAHCEAAGLALTQRWATWEGDPFDPDDAGYAVSVHRHATVTG